MRTGGIEAMINGLANEMAKTENVTVCSIFEPNEDDCFYHNLSSKIKKKTLHKKKKGFSLKEIYKIYQFIKSESFEIVQVHGFFVYYILAIFLLHKRSKFFYTLHSDAAMESPGWDQKLLFLKKFAFKHQLIRPITILPQSKISFEKIYNCDSRLIPNGIQEPAFDNYKSVDLEKYRKTPNSKIFLNIGRIDVPKNQVELCKIFQELISEGHDIVLLIAGPVADEEIFSKLKEFFSDRIVYLGSINNAQEYLYKSDAFVLPSIWEGLPVTLLEAISVGCIPICNPVGGIPSVINDSYNGLLATDASKLSFKKAVENFLKLTNKQIENYKSNCISTFLENYSITKTANSYLDYYNSVLTQTKQ